MLTDGQIDKEISTPQKSRLLVLKREKLVGCFNMDKPWEYHAEGNEPVIGQSLQDSVCLRYESGQTCQNRRQSTACQRPSKGNRTWLAQARCKRSTDPCAARHMASTIQCWTLTDEKRCCDFYQRGLGWGANTLKWHFTRDVILIPKQKHDLFHWGDLNCQLDWT